MDSPTLLALINHTAAMQPYRATTPLSEKVLRLASEVTAKAFIHSIAYCEIFRDDTTRLSDLQELFFRNFLLVQRRCPEAIYCYFADESCEEIVSVFMLVPSTVQFSLWDKLQCGLLWLLISYGLGPFKRLLHGSDWHDAMLAPHQPKEPFLLLQRMVVSPAFQGKGLGSLLLGNAIRSAEDLNLSILLGTQDSRNVVFYSRLGFKLVEEKLYEPGDNSHEFAYNNWVMRRDPHPIQNNQS